MGTAAAVASNDGGKSAQRLDEALGGAARSRGKPKGPVGVSTGQTFGEAAGEAAGRAQSEETAALLAEFD